MWRLASKEYRQGKARLGSLCQNSPPSGLSAQLEMLDAIDESRRLKDAIIAADSLGRRLYGSGWQIESSSWDSLSTGSHWLWQLWVDVELGNLPKEIVDFLAEGRSTLGLAESSGSVVEAISEYQRTVAAVVEAMNLDLAKRYPSGLRFEDQTFQAQESALNG